MRKIQISIEVTKDGWANATEYVTVDAYPTSSPFLAIHRSHVKIRENWVVTHVPSGRAVITFYMIKDARAFAEAVKDMLDWSPIDMSQLTEANTKEAFTAVRSVARNMHLEGKTTTYVPSVD